MSYIPASDRAKVTAPALRARKGGEPIVALTAYDFPSARLVDQAGVELVLVVGDLPFGTYHESAEQGVRSAVRFVKEGGVEAVKLEGGRTRAETVRRIVEAEIPVLGHIGLTPQSVHRL